MAKSTKTKRGKTETGRPGSKMPDCMMRFATSTLIFDFYASPTEEGQVPERLKSDPRTKNTQITLIST